MQARDGASRASLLATAVTAMHAWPVNGKADESKEATHAAGRTSPKAQRATGSGGPSRRASSRAQ